MKYEQVFIYYFSGTGNARNVAGWIRNVAQDHKLAVKVINIDRFKKIELPDTSRKTLIGFCAPTHGFNMPPIMLKFIFKFPRLKNADVFIINTRAGLKLSKLFIPGMSGIAQMLPAVILLLKSYRIVGMQPMDLPSNWIFLHPGLKQQVVSSITTRIKRITENFAKRILSGKTKYKALISLPIDLAVAPIAVGYYFIGRFYLAKTMMATSDCNLCMKCINECPVEAIQLKKMPFWTYRCESCMRCINACPKRAIEVTHTFSIGLLVLSMIVLMPAVIFLFDELKLYRADSPWLIIEFFHILKWIIFIIFFFITYRILHYLMRFKWVNKIVAYTSLSKYKFWRRYHAMGMMNDE